MMPDPTTAATSSAVPIPSAAARRPRFTLAANRGVRAVAVFYLGKDDVGLPATAVRIGRPHLILHRVAARFVGLDIDRVTGFAESSDRRVDVLCFLDDDAVMRTFRNARERIGGRCASSSPGSSVRNSA